MNASKRTYMCKRCGMEIQSDSELCVQCFSRLHIPCPKCMRRLPSDQFVVRINKDGTPLDFCQRCGDERYILMDYEPIATK